MTARVFCVLFVAVCAFGGSSATLINLENRCPYGITAFARHGNSPTNSYSLGANNGFQQLNVGPSFQAGLVFASRTGNENNAEATQLEITTAGSGGLDYYDISLVRAYNLPASIQPIDIPGGKQCGSPTCTINNLQSFCSSPNVYGDGFCLNTDGPGTSPTSGTRAFKQACPDAYSYNNDDASSTNTCSTGANYNFIFCP